MIRDNGFAQKSNEGVREAVSEPEAVAAGSSWHSDFGFFAVDPVATASGSDLFGFADFVQTKGQQTFRPFHESNKTVGLHALGQDALARQV